ncbi:MAG: hypothetical protein JNM93_08375 [Bacteriovoracaceae bacterium]|nr:hypothetical protein [Bacteriovoracaceae bacterium]
MLNARNIFYSIAPLVFIVLTLPILLVMHFVQKMKIRTISDFATAQNL